jgi:tetratricopeptide (TPR) repeat protein
MRKTIVIYFLLIFMVLTLSAQLQPIQQAKPEQSKTQLASMYYRDKQWEKARDLYLELYETNNMSHYFDYYIECLVNLKDFDQAVQSIRKQLRRSPNVNLQITLGYVYKEMGNIEKSNDTYNEIIDNLKGTSKAVVINVGNSFFNRREFEYAEKAYLKGREVLPGEMFRNNLASVYAYLRDYQKMMAEYLELLREDDKQVDYVQARISSLLRYDFDNSLRNTVKRDVIKAMQLYPNVIAYNRLLIWMFSIEKNYEQALNNAIALDRRTKTEETNIVEFARSAAQNQMFDIALSGLQYIENRKPEPPNINIIKLEIVNVEYQKFMSLPAKQRTNGNSLKQKFGNLLNELGYSRETLGLIRSYAHLLSFYLNDPEQANAVLEKGLVVRGLNNFERSLLRVEQADIMVYENKLWEATLLYAQIIEANRDNELGDEVKLKRAKLSFYIGDIEWARGQFDALKASTSKLIANNAMDFSLLISANYDLDTIAEPVQMFARADLLLFQNNDSLALLTYDSISAKFPQHTLNEHILFRKAGISIAQNELQLAASYYKNIVDNYPWSTVADDALYRLALLNQEQLNQAEVAQELFEKLLVNYPGSIFVADARYRFRLLRGDEIVQPETSPYEVQDFIAE